MGIVTSIYTFILLGDFFRRFFNSRHIIPVAEQQMSLKFTLLPLWTFKFLPLEALWIVECRLKARRSPQRNKTIFLPAKKVQFEQNFIMCYWLREQAEICETKEKNVFVYTKLKILNILLYIYI